MLSFKDGCTKRRGFRVFCGIAIAMILLVASFASASIHQTKCSAAQRLGKVKPSSIKETYSSYNTFVYKYKWKKVNGADGYQVRIIEAESFDFDNVIRTIDRETVFSNKARFRLESADDLGVYSVRVQVRAFRYKGVGYEYGPWSTSSKFMLYV